MSRELLLAAECVRCGLPFGVRQKCADDLDALLCVGCLAIWAQAGYPDELPPLGDRWTPKQPVPAPVRRMRRRRGDAARRPTDPEGYRP